MRYIIEVSGKQKIAIDELVKAGRYSSLQQFIEAAIENQLFVQDLPLGALGETSAGQAGQTRTVGVLASSRDSGVLARPTTILYSTRPVYASKKIIWGLYNRIFPSKIALRVLANLAEEKNTEFVNLGELQEEAGKQARRIGKALHENDEKSGRPQGEKLSTGLPIGKEEKSLARYADMFIGFLKSDGTPEGLPSDLGLVMIRLDSKGQGVAALTEKGKQFVEAMNPVIDKQDESMPDRTLSDDEADFYLAHIRRWLPSEWERSQMVLAAIHHGDNTPDELDAIFKAEGKNLTGDSIATERAGMISRMTELGLIRRKREGLRVSYSLTPRGTRYLEGSEKVETV